MAHQENPPFGRGETFYGINPAVAIDTSHEGGTQFEGEVWEFADLNYSLNGKPTRTNRIVKCMCVRNTSGAAILPRQAVALTGGNLGQTGGSTIYGAGTSGPCNQTAQANVYVADEWLPAAGCPANDLFWVVVEGPTTFLTPMDGTNCNWSADQIMVGLTAATSGATTAGRLYSQDLTGATAVLGNQIQNAVGRALSGVTTGNTNSSCLIDVFSRKW